MKHHFRFFFAISLSVVLSLVPSWNWSKRVPDSCDPGGICPALITGVFSASAVAQDRLSRYTNLKVLPEDISKEELIRTMKFITKSLGTTCQFCHRTDVSNYASDEIEKKLAAREMMRMVDRINRELFTWRGGPRATCFMCHRGQHKPSMHPEP